MQEPRLIIYKRIEELDSQIRKMKAKMFMEHTNESKNVYKEKIDNLEAAKALNMAIYYSTGEIQ